jgi:hypothetical protein
VAKILPHGFVSILTRECAEQYHRGLELLSGLELPPPSLSSRVEWDVAHPALRILLSLRLAGERDTIRVGRLITEEAYEGPGGRRLLIDSLKFDTLRLLNEAYVKVLKAKCQTAVGARSEYHISPRK